VEILVLRTGDAIGELVERRGEFARWIRETVGDDGRHTWTELDVRFQAPGETRADAIIITGSAASVTERAPWMIRTEAWLRERVEEGMPVLGICFGHQLLAQALGGRVSKNAAGREIGTVKCMRCDDDDPLFRGLPRDLTVNATHVDTVHDLPPGARILASSKLERHAAFAVKNHVWGVQFHPEIDGDIMRGYVDARSHVLRSEGIDTEALRAACVDTPHGVQILKNFVRLAASAGDDAPALSRRFGA
jgi:GMP synthase (glutamine-hydrolysing)